MRGVGPAGLRSDPVVSPATAGETLPVLVVERMEA